jgi:hypothetical protein
LYALEVATGAAVLSPLLGMETEMTTDEGFCSPYTGRAELETSTGAALEAGV